MLKHQCKVMGGPAQVFLGHKNPKLSYATLQKVLDELQRIERKFSFYIDSSLVSLINKSAGTKRTVAIDDEFASLLHFADTLYSESDGVFDPTAGILKDVWKLDRTSLPDDGELTEILRCVGWKKFNWSSHSAQLSVRGMKIDLGGIVKEYAVDSASKILRDSKIGSALVDLAGDISLIGSRPDGSPWEVSVRHPRLSKKAVTVLRLSDISIATSGDYERALIVNGKRYSHLINPKTGWPIDGLISCTVISEQCLIAGGSASTALLKKTSEGIEWLEDIGLPYLAIDPSLKVYSNLQNSFLEKNVDNNY